MKSKKNKTQNILSGNVFILGLGAACVGHGRIGDFGLLTVSHLKKLYKLGRKVKESDVSREGGSVILFSDTKSIDAMIERLEKIKKIIPKSQTRKNAKSTKILE